MRLTNIYDLPKPLENIAKRDDYSRGNAHISVTTLIDAPQIGLLRRRHDDEIEVDVADMLWSIVGRAIHKVVEGGADGSNHVEERLFADIDGWTLSGQIDLQTHGDGAVDIGDWKFTAAYSVLKEKIEWERQLNCYRWLAEKSKGIKVRNLYVFAFIRDWSRREAETNKAYPQAPVWRVHIRKWTEDECQKYVEERIALHKTAAMAYDLNDPLPECSDDERWIREKPFAVMKRGGRRALRTFHTAQEALSYKGNNPQWYVEDRTDPVRCSGNYCNVAKFCPQWRKMKEERNGGETSGRDRASGGTKGEPDTGYATGRPADASAAEDSGDLFGYPDPR